MADDDQDIRPALDILQSMIDISADRLVGLRTQCSTSVELTQREIRTLEGKLIKLFSRQLVIKSKLKDRFHSAELKNIPCLEQWLQVVGLCPDSIQCICSKVKTIEALQEKPQCKVKNLLCNCSQHDEELRRLSTALRNLKRYTDILLEGGNDVGTSTSDVQLHWDSWDWRYTLRALPQVIENTSPLPQDTIHLNGSATYIDQLGNINSFSSNCPISYSVPPTPTPPALSPPITPIHKSKDHNIEKSPGSVSAGNESCRHHRHNYFELLGNDIVQPISKSRSHESPLFNLSSSDSNSSIGITHENGPVMKNRRGRLSTVPGLEHMSTNSSLYSSPTRSPPYITTAVTTNTTISFDTPVVKTCDNTLGENNATINGNSIPVPRSPRTPTPITRGMAHDIAHRFTKHFSFNKPCDYCCKPIIMNTGLKCKECRYRCHRDCESKVPPSCGLPVEFVNEFKRRIIPDNYPSVNDSPILSRSPAASGHPSPGLLSQIERRGGSDSTPASSSHSSAPSSPALFITNHSAQPPPPATASAILTQKQQFDFSTEAVNKEKEHLINSQASMESNAVSDSDRTDSDKTVNREDSQDSQNWDGDSVDKVWPRQYSVSMKEWEIPWDDLKMGDKLGTGHFGTVYSGYWHGDVAIKVLNMECSADEKMLENFKSEVSTFRKTRHDNLVLFMGACMKPPRLAIVTSMMHGMTLYKYIHLRKDKFSMSKTTIIAQQISQGMGYLHAKGIVHKDLRTKNIFLEKERVIITDFGLFSVTKLCFKNRMQDGLIIPPGWLCYLAPEIMRNLRVHVRPDDEHLPFSKASDIYAFGTVWYELLCGDWPLSSQNPEAIIWQVGKGMKPSLANLEASRDVKDILMHCWSYQASKRPDFTLLLKTLDKLPKKRLARSPSHPVHLSRSAESMF